MHRSWLDWSQIDYMFLLRTSKPINLHTFLQFVAINKHFRLIFYTIWPRSIMNFIFSESLRLRESLCKSFKAIQLKNKRISDKRRFEISNFEITRFSNLHILTFCGKTSNTTVFSVSKFIKYTGYWAYFNFD